MLRPRCWLLLLCLALGLPGCQEPGAPPVAHRPSYALPLPPALRRLLAASSATQASIDRLRAAQAEWMGDSLSRLLIHSRLGTDFYYLHQFDSSRWHEQQAWRLAGPPQWRRQPAEVITLAQDIAHYYYGQAAYDSSLLYAQRAIATFRAAGLDSTHATDAAVALPSSRQWSRERALPSAVVGAGLASRHLGNLAGALRYYERAAALYQQQGFTEGVLWTQDLVGEAYAEQGDDAQAARAYKQAQRTARAYARRQPQRGSSILAGHLLDYYLPLLLADSRHLAYAGQLAAEARRILQAAYTPAELRADAEESILLAQLWLVETEVAQRRDQRAEVRRGLAAATRWLVQTWTMQQGKWRSLGDEAAYSAVQATAWTLRAWQQHPTNPAAARRLLDQATALLDKTHAIDPKTQTRRQLADYCLRMGEPIRAVALLKPLAALYQQQRSPLPLSQVTEQLTQAYARLGRYDSAYVYARRTQTLTDTVRAARQFAALAATEARFRTREQASQIRLLTERSRQQALRMGVVAGGAGLVALALLATLLAWRATRRLNQQLATQGALLRAQAVRLGELDEAKNQFFANVSHELRTPLTLVLSPLQQALAQTRIPALRELLTTSARHGQRLRELIDRILDLTKLEAGKLEAHPVPTRLAELLRGLVAQFEPLAAAAGVVLHAPPDLPEPLTVLLDADKLTQILTNLLANALQHTPRGGRVTLTVAYPGPDQYALTVQDTGPGIAAEEQAWVFERFYQSPQRQARGGTGLGLALSRELAQLLGGTLALASRPGAGAAFTLTFGAARLPDAAPATTPAPLPPTPLPRPAGLGARARILLVEDHSELRAFMRGLLAPTYEVLEAEDGRQALAVLAREAVDLVASDAMMPHLSGLELLHALKADPVYQGLPFLMVTARADDAHRLSALATGVDDYLIKPFDADELLACVRTLLTRYRARQAHAAQLPTPAGPTTTAEASPPGPATAAQLVQWQAQVAPQLAEPDFGPAELAELLCLSERTLYRRLGELAGLTPAAWLRELRLDHARRLLEAGNFGSVAAVADAAGFASPKYFTTLYTERFGRRPADYRA